MRVYRRGSKLDIDALEGWTDIQIQLDGVCLDGLLVVGQVLAALGDAGVSSDLEREDGVLVLARDETDDGELVDLALHGDGVVSRDEAEVGEERRPDGLAVDLEVHGHVAELEGHDGRVGNEDLANHVGAVSEDFVRPGEDLEVEDVEALELVETCPRMLDWIGELKVCLG